MTDQSAQAGDAVVAALQAVLASQHAAVYGLSVVGANLADAADIANTHSMQDGHRQVRDALMADLVTRGATPVAAQSSYRPAEKVSDVTSAQRWALQLEQACASAYRYLLATAATHSATGTASRAAALAGLTGSATSALYWRRRLTPATPTTGFPGL